MDDPEDLTLTDHFAILIFWIVRGGWKAIVTLAILAAGLHQWVWWASAILSLIADHIP